MKDRDELFHHSFGPDSPGREAADQQLAELLNLYEPPAASRRLDQRVVESFRGEQSRSGTIRLWRRMLTTSVRVPAPLAAAALLVLIAAIAWAIYPKNAAPAQALEPLAPSVRLVEVPVIQEKIVTRTVYLRRKNADRSKTEGKSTAARQNGSSLALFSSPAENGYVVQQSTDLRGFQPVPALKIKVIRRNDANED